MKLSKGFTLVEVLISAVILFSALAITAELYKASSFSANKIIDKAQHFQKTQRLISTIRSTIRLALSADYRPELSGTIVDRGIEYNWVATRESFKSRPSAVDEVSPPSPQFGLYVVIVTPISDENTYSEYSFKVATW